jgi:hypothetical protein
VVDLAGPFRLIPLPDAFEEDLQLRAVVDGYTAIDVQLTGDALTADEAFTEEYGRMIGPGHYRHESLADRLGAAEIARVRRFVAALLRELTIEGDGFVWFLDGASGEPGDEPGDERIWVRGYVDEARFNGSFVICGDEREGVSEQAERLGRYDRVRGAAGPGLSLARVLPALGLATPIPTSSVRLSVGPPFVALAALLPLVDLFFEEVRNGTRLRLVTQSLSIAQIARAVVAARLAAEETPGGQG